MFIFNLKVNLKKIIWLWHLWISLKYRPSYFVGVQTSRYYFVAQTFGIRKLEALCSAPWMLVGYNKELCSSRIVLKSEELRLNALCKYEPLSQEHVCLALGIVCHLVYQLPSDIRSYTVGQGFSNFCHGDPNVSLKILRDPKQRKKVLRYQRFWEGVSLLASQSLSKFRVTLDTVHHKSALSWFFILWNVDFTFTATCFMNFEEGFLNEILNSKTFV